MSDINWRASLVRSLNEWGTRGSFFAVVAALERAQGGDVLGTEARPSEERIRFRHCPSLAFASGDVTRVGVDDAQGAVEIETTFLGTSGLVGALPAFMLEEIAQDDSDRPLRRELLDVFHHRALSLLYRSVQRLRLSSVMRRGGDDFWSQRLVAAAGAPVSRLEMDERLRILPLLATSRRSALGLERALHILVSRRLGSTVNLELRELRGQRVAIADPCRTRLGRRAHALGRDTVLGARAADASGRATLVIFAIDPRSYLRFLPGGDIHGSISEVFRLFDSSGIELQLELHVDAEKAGFALDRTAALGRQSWLSSKRKSRTIRVAA
jgi:type VI secretion system protein ImpH